MTVLLDTNILLRLSEPSHMHHSAAVASVRMLASQEHTFCIASQTISEFMAVATRPVTERGLGMGQVGEFCIGGKVVAELNVLYDSPNVPDELRRIVIAHAVTGKSVHDAKLVAAMNVQGVTHLLTFNGKDFARYVGVIVLDPSKIAGGATGLK